MWSVYSEYGGISSVSPFIDGYRVFIEHVKTLECGGMWSVSPFIDGFRVFIEHVKTLANAMIVQALE